MGEVANYLLAMDVDGTLTDGGIYLSSDGQETKRYDVKDGMAIVSFRKAGGHVALISGRYSKSTELRAKELGVVHLFNGTKDKIGDLTDLASRLGIDRSKVLFVGDDVNDLDCVQWAGIGVSVGDGVDRLKAEADWITERSGGHGAIREVVDRLLKEILP
nr:HAD hydrolase family protein [uncultured Dethiosulfovibrio sp.]